jgi:hypothetical protein
MTRVLRRHGLSSEIIRLLSKKVALFRSFLFLKIDFLLFFQEASSEKILLSITQIWVGVIHIFQAG